MTSIYLGDAQGRGGADLRADGSKVSGPRPLRLLLSYHYYKDEDVGGLLESCFRGVDLDVFADSGAYSAWSVGQPVVEEAYVAWATRWAEHFTAVAGPDVIGDPVKTFAATERMRAKLPVSSILPTFHVGEDWSWLRKMVDAGYDYLAFGGMVPYTRQRKLLDAWLQKAWAVLPEGQRVHGFGLTTWPLLLRYPWYSVDSSSWTAGFRYAQLQLFDDRLGRFVEVKMGDPKSLLGATQLLDAYGLRPSQARADGYDRDLMCGVCVESWQRAEAWLSARKGGMKTFLVSASASASANNSPQTIASGVRAYLSAGAEGGVWAPNRPDGIARGLKRRPT